MQTALDKNATKLKAKDGGVDAREAAWDVIKSEGRKDNVGCSGSYMPSEQGNQHSGHRGHWLFCLCINLETGSCDVFMCRRI